MFKVLFRNDTTDQEIIHKNVDNLDELFSGPKVWLSNMARPVRNDFSYVMIPSRYLPYGNRGGSLPHIICTIRVVGDERSLDFDIFSLMPANEFRFSIYRRRPFVGKYVLNKIIISTDSSGKDDLWDSVVRKIVGVCLEKGIC